MLSFQKGNAKLDKKVYTFSLPSGYTCPFALDCLSKSDRVTGKIRDGKETVFRCFSASQEALYKNVRESRWRNFDALRAIAHSHDTGNHSAVAMAAEIMDGLPKKANIVRIHVAGDFFSQDYFDAWALVAKYNPNTLFYAYTKSLDYWVNRLGTIPKNFVLTASWGGRHDYLIETYGLRHARVVYSEAEASNMGLEIDHDDSHAMADGPAFALLIHGVQPKGSKASVALSTLKKAGKHGYNKKNRLPLATI